MSPAKKTIIAILTLLPILFMILYFVSIFSFIRDAQHMPGAGGTDNPEEIMGSFASMFAYIGIAVLLTLGMLIFYIYDITKNPRFQDGGNNKLIWILVVVFAGMVGMIVYFFVEIYPRKELPPMPNEYVN